jgi:hypothetical protein
MALFTHRDATICAQIDPNLDGAALVSKGGAGSRCSVVTGNLVLLCRRHHRIVHEEGWQLVITADGDIVAIRP